MKRKAMFLIFIFLCAVVFFQSVSPNAQIAENFAQAEFVPQVSETNLITKPSTPDVVGATTDPYYKLADEYLVIADNQTSVGLCWSFAITKQIETYLAVNFDEYYNFSEAWVSVAYRYYVANNTLGVNDIANYKIGDGGHYITYKNAVNTYGIMLENDFPYENIYNIGEDNYEEYFNAYKDLASKDLIADLKFGYFGDYNTENPPNKQQIKSDMKEYIQNDGGIYCAIDSGRFTTNEDGSEFCLSVTSNHLSGSTNHAMTIVGWDDTYTCTVGDTTYTGAWITLNSYGADRKYVYVMYDDANVSYTYVVIGDEDGGSALTYNGIEVDMDNPENYSGLLLSDSNSNYTNLEIADTSKLQKNLFEYNTEFVPSLTYTFSSTYANSSFDFEIWLDNVNKTDQFTLTKNNTQITLDANAPLGAGYYKIKIKVDTDSNGTIDETHIKSFAIFSGAEIEYVISYANNSDKELMYQNQNSLLRDGTTYYGFTNGTALVLRLYFAEYSKIKSYTLSGLTFNNTSSTFTPATFSNYASGYLWFQFSFSNQVTIHNSTLKFTTTDGYEFSYQIKIFRYDNVNTNYITKLNYFLDGGINDPSNTNAIILSTNPSNLFYKQYINAPTKEHYTFLGWYQESNFVNKIPNDENGYFLRYNNTSVSGLNYLYYDYNLLDQIIPYYVSTNGINYKILYAKWEITNYSITYNLDGGDNNIANPSSYNFETETFTLLAPTKTGFTFSGWSGTDIVGTTETITISQGSTGDKTYTANWQENTYTIAYSNNGGSGTISNSAVSYTSNFTTAGTGSEIYNTNTNIVLVGWKVNNTDNVLELDTQYAVETICEYADVVNTNGATITLYAVWEQIAYSISYELNSGTNSAQNPSSYTYETDTFTLQEPTKTGYTFDGWTGSNGITPQKSVTINTGSTGDKTYTANWQENTYTIVYNENGGTGSVSSLEGISYTGSFTTAGLSAGILHTDLSKDLTGWKVGETDYVLELDTEYLMSIISGYNGAGNTTITLYASWEIEIFAINFYDFDKTTVVKNEEIPRGTTYDFSDYSITKQNTAKFTYTFAGWYESSNYEGEPITNIVVNHNINLYAKFDSEINKYTISFYNEENELLDSTSFDYDTVLTFFTMSGENKTYNQDFVVIKPNTTVQNFTFAGWFNTNNYTTELQNLTVTENKSIYAKYLIENQQFVINVYNANGLISQTINYTFGDTAYDLSSLTVQKPSTAQYSYTFEGWYDNPDFSGEPITSILITEDYSLENIYPLLTENLRRYNVYLYQDNSYETIYSTLTYDYGQTINLSNITITKQSDEYFYTFLGWYNTNGVLQTSSITITENLSFYAEFNATKIFVQLSAETIQILEIVGLSILGVIILASIIKIAKVKKINRFNKERARRNIQSIKEQKRK